MIPTRDRKRSKVFYAGKLGLKLVSEDPFAMEFDAHGTQLRITTVPELTPHKFSVMSWYVKDVRAVLKELAAARVKFEMFDVTNMKDADAGHMGSVELIVSGDKLTEKWGFMEKDKPVKIETFEFHRKAKE